MTAPRKPLDAAARARHVEAQQRYRRRHPERVAAQGKAQRARRRGELVSEPCQACGDPRTEMHHPDYAEPLRVEHYCRPCHVAEHVRLRAERAERAPRPRRGLAVDPVEVRPS
ncbi:hypothetical protein M446_1160 [Methylobacterium sp. 4-46]|uniref:hypothetical protein n=1 Tax=unclassified Methylobacterium TaxID=2615210 RepID=UPI000165C88C|nr:MULTISPECIES: hypothetical protein [Methylobacterium]ACA15686.1 hypothetical protein M446_1160 [Methylobacterium sp. 4-46]WFT81397.1 hypothetical protein QA634_05765 [Methylobacterium nodulans]